MEDLEKQERPFDPEKSTLEKDRRASSFLRSFMEKSKQYREPHLDLADRARTRYTNWELDEISKIRRANLKPSYGFTIIETLVPQLSQFFLGETHIIKFKGRDYNDASYEDVLTDFFDIQFSEMNFSPKFVAFIKNMLLDGTAVAKVPYRYQEILTAQRRTETDPLSGESYRVKENVIKVLFDGPDIENIPLYDFYPDWQVKEPGNVQKMRGCVHRMYKTMSDLKAAEKKTLVDGTTLGVYKNLDELKTSMSVKGCKAWSAPYWSDEHKESAESLEGNKSGIKDSDKIEVWEYWGLFDLDGTGDLVEAIITIANGDVVIRCEENFYDCKFKPFVACPNYLRPNEFYGIPELSPVDSEIKEATALRNARLDQVNIGINTMWLVDRSGGIDTKNLYSRPNGIIYTNDMNAIRPINPSEPSVSSANEISQIEQNIAQTSAVGAPPIQGSSKSFARSATGVNYLASFGNTRLGLKAMILAEMAIKPLVEIMMQTNRQFVTEDQVVRMKSPDAPNPFAELPTDAFYRDFDFMVKTKLDLSDDAEFQKLQAASQIIQVMEQTQPGSTKLDVIGEALLRPLVGPAVKKFMRTQEELEQLKIQNAALRVQEQAANAEIGKLAPQPNARGINEV